MHQCAKFLRRSTREVDNCVNFVDNQEACSGLCFAFDLILFCGRAMRQSLVSAQEILVMFDDF